MVAMVTFGAVLLQYLVGFGGFTGCRDDEECLSELCYIDLAERKIVIIYSISISIT